MLVSLTCGGRENVPRIPGPCTTRNFMSGKRPMEWQYWSPLEKLEVKRCRIVPLNELRKVLMRTELQKD